MYFTKNAVFLSSVRTDIEYSEMTDRDRDRNRKRYR